MAAMRGARAASICLRPPEETGRYWRLDLFHEATTPREGKAIMARTPPLPMAAKASGGREGQRRLPEGSGRLSHQRDE